MAYRDGQSVYSVFAARRRFSCRFSCRLTPTLSGVMKSEQRQITLSVNDLTISCRTSYSLSVA